jgi:hypothetical protein
MAADTIKFAGRKLPRQTVIVAGAVGVGIVGYAWFSRRPDTIPDEVVTETELDAVGDERIPTTGVPYDPNTEAPSQGIVTNAEWSQFATDRLNGLGYDPIAVADALGMFLDRKPLAPAQANIARAAISQAGEPPQGRPWTVIVAQAPAAMPALGSFRAAAVAGRPDRLLVTWAAPASGQVQVRIVNPPTGVSSAWRIASGTSWTAGALRAGTTYTFEGRVVQGSVSGPTIATSGRTASSTSTSPAPTAGRPPAAPGSLGVLPLGPGRVGLSWPAVRGATRYRYRWETARSASAWTTTSRTSLNVTWKFAKGTQFTAVVQAGNKYGWSAIRRGNRTTAR